MYDEPPSKINKIENIEFHSRSEKNLKTRWIFKIFQSLSLPRVMMKSRGSVTIAALLLACMSCQIEAETAKNEEQHRTLNDIKADARYVSHRSQWAFLTTRTRSKQRTRLCQLASQQSPMT